MKLDPTAIPQGTRTYLFEEAAHKRFIEHAVHSVMRSRGFQEIVTPPIEYYESMITGLNEEERNRIIRFTEGDTGRIVALRGDITSQAARSAATHLSARPLPLRLCYTGTVFRAANTRKGEQYVLHQSGMEIIGHKGTEADIEVILAAVTGLNAVHLENFTVSLGHAGFVKSFLRGLDPACIDSVKSALGKKDKTGLKKMLKECGVEKSLCEKIIALTSLYGGREVFNQADKLCGNGAAREALKNLTTVYDALEKAHIGEKLSIDLGETRGFGYYTGMTMEIFSAAGFIIGSGGRYDNLVKRFGPDIPAVGFAFDIDKMIEALRRETTPPAWRASDILLLDSDEKTTAKLREAGMMVTTPFESMDEPQAISYAKKMNIPHVLMKGSNGKYDNLNVESGKKQKCTMTEFINGFFK